MCFLCHRNYDRFHDSDEARPIEQLLEAYYESDQEVVDSVVKNPLFRFMDNEVRILSHYSYFSIQLFHQAMWHSIWIAQSGPLD